MPLHNITGDLLKFKNKADAIVVPANKEPVVGYGLDSRLFKAAGFKQVMDQRKTIGKLRLGQAKETCGFRIAKYLIHTATPMWLGGTSGECEKLRSCYINSIKCADRLGLKSIAFPLLSSGNMRFPRGTAYETAVQAISERLKVHDSLDVYLVKDLSDELDEFHKAENIFEHSDSTMYELLRLKADLSEIIDPDRETVRYLTNVTDHIAMKAAKEAQKRSFEEKLPKFLAENPDKKSEDLQRERFYEYFETCGKKAARLAELIGIEKSTVSRIKNGQTLHPQKKTVIALAIAMELPTEQRYDFINCSGHSYPSEKMDYMIEQLFRDGYKNISSINDFLYQRNKEWLLIGNKNDGISEIEEYSKER
ncbi:MAG: macro domain-containing protein [Oscillospiraceae bacterium]|nr:macro domain-containing protein [Oscillospiraceae bacterium]